MRSLANSTVIAPADSPTSKQAVRSAAEYHGPVYLSLTRDPVFPFELGKTVTIRDGSDVTIIAMRDIVVQALMVAEQLAQSDGLSVRVIYCHTIKPFDNAAVLQAAAENNVM